jgi:hypothetical protein
MLCAHQRIEGPERGVCQESDGSSQFQRPRFRIKADIALWWGSRWRKKSLLDTLQSEGTAATVRKGKQIATTGSVAKKVGRALEFVFGCWHRNRSRPFTLSGWTYVVCLNCGKQFGYIGADFGSAGATKAKATMPAPR